MIKVWYVNGDLTAPQETECKVPGYPNKDVEGRIMYPNTHFADAEAAWSQLLAEHEAGLRQATGALRDIQAQVQRATAGCAEAACKWDEAKERYGAWKREVDGR